MLVRQEDEEASRKRKREAGGSGAKKGDGEDDVNSDCDDGLSGDEVDASLIISGGRASRRGRATFESSYSYAKAGPNDPEDSSEDDA